MVHTFHSNGKLLLTGEYFVLNGAESIALPTQMGQWLSVNARKSGTGLRPGLFCSAYDYQQRLWLSAQYRLPDIKLIATNDKERASILQQVLLSAKAQNPNFLDSATMHIHAATRLDFSLAWGLGSSSTFINNIAQWAGVDAFKILSDTLGGSGYDIACATCNQPITYKLVNDKPHFETQSFLPPFADSLYFVYLGKKKNSRQGVKHFYDLLKEQPTIIEKATQQISKITKAVLTTTDLQHFTNLMQEHESIVAKTLQLAPAQSKLFPDFNGTIKSLGAWGGDFVLAIAPATQPADEVKTYFANKAYPILIPYKDLVAYPDEQISINREVV